MSARHAVLLLVLAALASGVPMAASASATDLKCQARATYQSSPPPVDVSFEALAGDGQAPFVFEWEFGDGATSSEQNPSHTYTTSSVDGYRAIVRVTDSGTPPQTCRDTVVVYVGIVVDPSCIATANVRWGEAPLSVQFLALPGLGPDPDAWTWGFGDGESGAGQGASHGYAVPGTYWAVATADVASGSYDCYPTIRVSALSHDVADAEPLADEGNLRLEAARPNPFRAMTAIGFSLPRPGHVRLAIVDVSGRSVAELLNGHHPSGRGVGIWQGRASSGRAVPAGLYFATLEHEGIVRSIRLVRSR